MARPSTTDELRAAMVRGQLRARGIRDPRVLEAMGRIPRECFVPAAERPYAYEDRALPISCGQTISQPYIVARMSEALELTGTESVLEIGTGSGYQAAVLSQLARRVISIERHPELARSAATALGSPGYENVRVIEGDGAAGCPEEAPFDRIIVTAATDQIPPALWEQLREGGRLVLPCGDTESQMLQAIRKVSGSPQTSDLCACRFVPFYKGGSE